MAKKGEKLSDEHKRILIESNKSRVWTDEMREKRTELCRKTHTGRKHSEETKIKIRASNLGKRHKCEGKTPVREAIRKCFKYRQWRSDIFERDDYTCQFCLVRGGVVLNADHIKPFHEILDMNEITTLEDADTCEELWNLNNGRTLCEACHRTTDTYGRPKSKKQI